MKLRIVVTIERMNGTLANLRVDVSSDPSFRCVLKRDTDGGMQEKDLGQVAIDEDRGKVTGGKCRMVLRCAASKRRGRAGQSPERRRAEARQCRGLLGVASCSGCVLGDVREPLSGVVVLIAQPS